MIYDIDRAMTLEELEKENEALRQENARLTTSVEELLKIIEDYKAALEALKQDDLKNQPSESSALVKKLMKKVADLPISVRSKNFLYAADCDTLGDLVKLQKTDLLKFRNCGKNILVELSELVDLCGLSWGMEVDGIIEADMKEFLEKKVAPNK